MLEKMKNNKYYKFITSLLYAILVIFILAILLVVVLQRVSNNSLSVGGFRVFNIVTGSMVPKYNVGDVLISKETESSNIKVGDDVVYLGNTGTFKDRIVTHQVIGVEEENGKYIFQTKGLANETEDPKISEDQVYGVIIHKMMVLSWISKLINNLYSFYFIVFIPFVIYIAFRIRGIVKDYKEEHADEYEEDDEEEDDDDDEEDDEDDEEDNKEDSVKVSKKANKNVKNKESANDENDCKNDDVKAKEKAKKDKKSKKGKRLK